MTDLINQWMNDEAVYRTAPATPGLLKRVYTILGQKSHQFENFAPITNLVWLNHTRRLYPIIAVAKNEKSSFFFAWHIYAWEMP